MIEGRALQYDVQFDSQRFTALQSNGATEQEVEGQKSYIQRQLETDIGERLHVAESHYIYNIGEDGRLYAQGDGEPFLDVIKRGVVQRFNGTRENAEHIGMQFIESYLPNAQDGSMVFFPSPPGGVYAENYLVALRRVGNEVHSVVYLSTLDKNQSRDKILQINPAYEQVIPENPKDTDFLLNPVVVPSHLNMSPDDLADFILEGKTGMDEAEFRRIKNETAAVRISYILYLAQHPEDVEGLEMMYKAVLAATRRAKDGGYKPTFIESKMEIHYLAHQKETLAGGGCGSGACSVGAESALAKSLGLEPDIYGERVFTCPKCGAENVRWVKDQLISKCQNQKCQSDEVLPQNFRAANFQPGLSKVQ